VIRRPASPPPELRGELQFIKPPPEIKSSFLDWIRAMFAFDDISGRPPIFWKDPCLNGPEPSREQVRSRLNGLNIYVVGLSKGGVRI
jgi:hypothetical protein